VRADLPERLALEIVRLAEEERPAWDPRDAPLHAGQYESLLGGEVESGPESKRIPVYSTSWSNEASLAVASKLRLVVPTQSVLSLNGPWF